MKTRLNAKGIIMLSLIVISLAAIIFGTFIPLIATAALFLIFAAQKMNIVNNKFIGYTTLFFIVSLLIAALVTQAIIPIVHDIKVSPITGKAVSGILPLRETSSIVSINGNDVQVLVSSHDAIVPEITYENDILTITKDNKTLELSGVNQDKVEVGLDVLENSEFIDAYAIDPTKVNYTSANITVIAQGNSLFKCKDWNFETQECQGRWQKVRNINAGQEYSVEISPEDPGFGEGNYTVELLDENSYLYNYTENKTNIDADHINVSLTINDNGSIIKLDINSKKTNENGKEVLLIKESINDSRLQEGVTIDTSNITSDSFEIQKIAKGKSVLECANFSDSCLSNWTKVQSTPINQAYETLSSRKKTTYAETKDTIAVFDKNFNLLQYDENITSNTSTSADVEYEFTGFNIKKLKFYTYNKSSNSNDLVVEHNVDISSPSGKIASTFSIDPTNLTFSYAELTATASGSYLFKCKNWNASDQTCLGTWNKLAVLTPGQDYTINLTAEDPGYLETNNSIVLIDDNETLLDYNETILSNENNMTNIKLDIFNSTNINRIIIYSHNESSDEDILKIKYSTNEAGYLQSYSIDPTNLSFANATVTVTAKGTQLYKCPDWNFTSQTCIDGNWTLFKSDLVPGQEYNFTLTAGDPGLGEVEGSFFEGFESGSLTTNNWTNTGVGSWAVSSASKYAGSNGVGASNVPSGAILETNISTAGYYNITFSLYAYASGSFTAGSENISAEWYNGTAWIAAMPGTINSAYTLYSYNLSSSASNNANFRIRINCFSNSAAKKCYVDNINVSGTFVTDTTPPAAITNLTNTSSTDTSITWNWTNPADSDFSSAIIYLNGTNVQNTSNNYYAATGLSSSTNYTIRINTKDTAGNVNYTNVTNTASTTSSQPPKVTINYPRGQIINTGSKVFISANVSSSRAINSSVAQITLPNGTISNYTMGYNLQLPSDNFDTNSLGTNWLFENINLGPSQTCIANINTTVAGKAHLSMKGTGTPLSDTWCSLVSTKIIDGDFDMNVSFTMSAETLDDYAFNFGISDVNSSYYSSKSIFMALSNWNGQQRGYEIYAQDENYSGYILTKASADTTGKMRIKRTGNNFTFYLWSGSAWNQETVSKNNFNLPRQIYVYFDIENSAPKWGTVNVSLDDFGVKSENSSIVQFNQTSNNGAYSFKVIAMDSLGLVNSTSTSNFTIGQVNSPPTIPWISNPSDNEAINGSYLIAWNPITDSNNDTIALNISLLNLDSTFNSTIVSNYGNINTVNYTFDSAQKANGTYNLQVMAFETATLEKYSSQYTVNNLTINNVDTTAPSVSLVSPASNYTEMNTVNVNFTYNVSDASSIANCTFNLWNNDSNYLENNQTSISVTKNINQTFSYTFSLNGNYKWNVTCTDSSNNQGLSESRNFTLAVPGIEAQGTWQDSGLVCWPNPVTNGSKVLCNITYTCAGGTCGKNAAFYLKDDNVIINDTICSGKDFTCNGATKNAASTCASSFANSSLCSVGYTSCTSGQTIVATYNYTACSGATAPPSQNNINASFIDDPAQGGTDPATLTQDFIENISLPNNYPTWSSNQTSIQSTYSPTALSLFNITWQDDIGVSLVRFESNYSGSAANYTMNRISGNSTNGVYNYSAILPAGTFYWKSYANDTTNQLNSTSSWTFTIAKATPTITKYLNGIDNNLTATYPQQVNASSSANAGTLAIYSNGAAITNGANYTLGVGYYRIDFNVTGNQNYTNASTVLFANITQANSQTGLTFDKTTPQNYTTAITPTCSLIAGSGTPTLTVNGTTITSGSPITLGVGTWTFNCSIANSQNYTAASNLSNFVINQATPSLSLLNTTAFTVTYPTQTNISGSGCPSQLTCTLYRNNVSVGSISDVGTFGFGNYVYVYNTTGNANYTNASTTNTLIVNQNVTTTSVLTNPASPINYGLASNFSCSNSAGLTTNMTINGTDKNSEKGINVTRGVGTYTINCSFAGNANYSASSQQTVYTINQANQLITPLLNGNNANLAITYPQQINASHSGINQTAVSIKINGTSVNIGQNYTWGVGVWDVNYSAPANQNYSTFEYHLNLTVSQASGSGTLLLNGTAGNISLAYPSQVNASFTNSTGAGTLLRNGTDVTSSNNQFQNLAVGYYNFTLNVAGSQNYSAFTLSRFANVTIATPILTITNSTSLALIYPMQTNFNCTADTAQVTPLLFRNGLNVSNPDVQTLGVGSYNYTCNNTATQNYTAANAAGKNLTVSQSGNPVNLYLNGNQNQNVTITYGTPSNATGTATTGAALFRNGLNVSNPEIATLAANATGYAYKVNATGNANYSDNATGLTYYLFINKSTPVLNLSLNSLESNITIDAGTSILLNCSVSNSGTINLYKNGTLINSGASPLSNLTIFSNLGIYNITCIYSGDQNYTSASKTYYVNVTDTIYPSITVYSPTPTSYIGQQILVNFTASDNVAVSSLWYNNETSNVSYTSGIVQYVNVSTGTHTFIFYANDTSGNLNFTNVSFEAIASDLIPPTYSNITINPNSPATYASGQNYEFNITWTENVDVDTAIINFNGTNYTMSPYSSAGGTHHFNFTISNLAVGNYSYYFWANDTTGNANQTGILNYTINKAPGQIILKLNDTENNITLIYGSQLNASASSTTGTVTLYRDGTNVTNENNAFQTLGVGDYNYTAISSETQNYSAASITRFVNITQATPSLSLLNTIAWTVEYKNITNISGAGCPSQLTCTLYRNNVNVTSPDVNLFAVGNYTYVYNTTGNANYTTASTTNNLTVNKSNSIVYTYLNNSRSDLTIALNSSIWLNGTLQQGEGIIQLLVNGIVLNSGNSPLSNEASFNNISLYNITTYYPETQNYTSSSETFWLNAVDLTPPTIQFVDSTTASGSYSQSSIYANVTAEDIYLDQIAIRLYNSTGLVSSSSSAASPLFASFTGLVDGTYYLNATANDTSGNSNKTETRTIILDTTNPTASFGSGTDASGYLNRQNIIVNVTANDSNLASITVNLYNSTGLVNSTSSASSPLFLNFTGLNDGNYYFNATVLDSLGHATSTVTRTIIIDTILPVFNESQTRPVLNRIVAQSENVSLIINATDNNAIANVNANISWDSTSQLISLAFNPVSGFYEETFNNTILPGLYNADYTATDVAGNANITRTNFTVFDSISPIITSANISNYAVIINDTVLLNATATDLLLDSVFVNITLPNGTIMQFNVPAYFNATLPGRYNITFIANDTSGNTATFEDYFMVGDNITFQVNVINSNLAGINNTLDIYLAGTDRKIHTHEFNGSYFDEHPALIYDLLFKAYNDSIKIKLRDVNLSADNNKTFGIDNLIPAVPGYLATYGVNNTYNITNATVILNYSGLSYSNENYLNAYKCDDWDFTVRGCISGWHLASSIKNTTSKIFSIDVNGFSGFSIREDIPSVPVTPATGTGGGGGGIYAPKCAENWRCTDWICEDGTAARKCIDKNKCGTLNYKPEESAECSKVSGCFNNRKDENETDADCGGDCSVKCIAGKQCNVNSDCITDICYNGICITKENVTEQPTLPTEKPVESIAVICWWIWILMLIGMLALILSLKMADYAIKPSFEEKIESYIRDKKDVVKAFERKVDRKIEREEDAFAKFGRKINPLRLARLLKKKIEIKASEEGKAIGNFERRIGRKIGEEKDTIRRFEGRIIETIEEKKGAIKSFERKVGRTIEREEEVLNEFGKKVSPLRFVRWLKKKLTYKPEAPRFKTGSSGWFKSKEEKLADQEEKIKKAEKATIEKEAVKKVLIKPLEKPKITTIIEEETIEPVKFPRIRIIQSEKAEKKKEEKETEKTMPVKEIGIKDSILHRRMERIAEEVKKEEIMNRQRELVIEKARMLKRYILSKAVEQEKSKTEAIITSEPENAERIMPSLKIKAEGKSKQQPQIEKEEKIWPDNIESNEIKKDRENIMSILGKFKIKPGKKKVIKSYMLDKLKETYR